MSDAPTVDHGRSSPKIADSQPTPAPGSRPFDPGRERFETRGELGRGGMGRVDEAYDHALGRQVAIKHVLSQGDVDLARFEREARITARLEHPGIVPVHDIGRSADGTPYYVMRRFDGQPLSDIIGDKPLAERLRVVPNLLAACDAAAFAHSHGIVHRDIKPTNILVGPFGETLLIDWGLARELTQADDKGDSTPISDSKLTRAGTVAGTPGFMSPEQARGETVDARADVFALGATLFYVLAGKLPWHGGSTEMIDHVGAGRPPDWRLMPGEVPADLRAIVEKAMATNLDERYADAAALAADLRNFTLGNLVVAYEYGWFARLARFVRRHRAAVSIAAISLVVLAIVAIVSVRRVLAERDDANAARALAEKRQKEAREAADRLLVTHARELVDVDPVEAIAALRTLPEDSPSWSQAWAIASAARYKGIPIGFVGLDETAMPQIAADDAHAFVIGFQTGHMLLIDIAKRTARDLGKLGRVSQVGWFDNSHFVAVTADATLVIDIASGNRRALPGLANADLYTNRAGLAVFLQGTQLFELTGADATPRLVDSSIDSYTPSADLDAAVVRRGRKRELWTNGTTFAMPDLTFKYDPTYIVRKGLVIAYEVPDIVAWDVIDGKLVQRGRWPQTPLIQAVLYATGGIFAAGHQGYERVDALGVTLQGEFSTFLQARTGAVLAANDGSLVVRDDDGSIVLGRRHAAYARFDLSNDGRFVIATTLTGEVLVWDLSELRPATLSLAPDETPVMLDARALWTSNVSGFDRVDLTTEKRAPLFDMVSPMSVFVESTDLRAVAVLDLARGLLQVGELGTTPFVQDAVNAVGSDDHEIIFGRENGELATWQPGAGKKLLATFDQPVEIVAANGGYAVAAVGDLEIVRIDVRTGVQERAKLEEKVDTFAVAETGDLWLIVGGAAYRWRIGAAAPTALATPEPVDSVREVDGVAVFHSPRSLLVYERDTPHVIAKASRYQAVLDGGLLAIADAKYVVSIVDIATGASFELPLDQAINGVPMHGNEDRVGYTTGIMNDGTKRFGVFHLTVPREPAALRSWLSTVTNSLPVPGSEAVAWPKPTR